MQKPRIALFTGNYIHIRDGVSNTLNRLVGYLGVKGYEVLVFGPGCPEPAIRHEGKFIPVYSIPAPFRPEYRIALGFTAPERQILREFDPDIIHIATPDMLGWKALRYAIKHDIPVVSSYHTHFSSYLKYYRLGLLEPLLWRYLFWFYRKCEQLYVPSPSMMEDLRRMKVESELKLWTRGVDTSLFSPDQRDPEWRLSLGFKAENVVVTFISRLVWEKNLEAVVSIFSRLRNINPLIRTLIVGEGPAQKELSQRLPETVFTGYLSGQVLARAYASSDLFFFPSETEAFGNVTLEAMSSGLPAVVADANGSRSLVTQGENGFIAGATDNEALLSGILKIAEDRDLRGRMSRLSREKAGLYDWDRVMDSIISCYQEVYNRKKESNHPDSILPETAM